MGKELLETVNGRGLLEDTGGETVQEMDSSQDGFTLEKLGHMHVKEQTAGGFKNMPEFPFG